MNAKNEMQKKDGNATTSNKKPQGFSDEEKAAMKERAKELKAEERIRKDKAKGEKALLEKIAEMPEPDRTMAARVHEIIKASVPELFPKTWYGMPAYANQDGKVICFFQNPQKFNVRYATLGFNDTATLDEGDMWPTAYAVDKLTPTVEKKIAALVKQAVS